MIYRSRIPSLLDASADPRPDLRSTQKGNLVFLSPLASFAMDDPDPPYFHHRPSAYLAQVRSDRGQNSVRLSVEASHY